MSPVALFLLFSFFSRWLYQAILTPVIALPFFSIKLLLLSTGLLQYKQQDKSLASLLFEQATLSTGSQQHSNCNSKTNFLIELLSSGWPQ
jgi:hypothetical protein